MRMATVVFAALVAIGPLKLDCPAQTDKADTQAKHRPSAQPPTVVVNITAPNDESAAGKKREESQPKSIRITQMPPSDGWYKAYVIATMILVIVGSIGVYKAHETLRAIKLQAQIMQRQTEATEKAARAAVTSAGAAKASADALTRIERAWLMLCTIEPKGETFYYDFIEGASGKPVEAIIKLANYGRSPAWLVESNFRLVRSESRSVPLEYGIPTVLPNGEPIPPQHHGIPVAVRLEPLEPFSASLLTRDEAQQIEERKLFLYLYGFAKYKDIFFEETRIVREIYFCFVFQTYREPGLPLGRWEYTGPPEANRYT